MELAAVAAVAENGAIGKDGELPWPRIPADKRQYRTRVAGSPVILGRRTFESMREDPAGDSQVVLSREPDRSYPDPSVRVVGSVDDAIDHLESVNVSIAYVLGGGAVYESFFPHLDTLLVSRVPGGYVADTYFPEIDPAVWERVDAKSHEGFTLETWVRRGSRDAEP